MKRKKATKATKFATDSHRVQARAAALRQALLGAAVTAVGVMIGGAMLRSRLGDAMKDLRVSPVLVAACLALATLPGAGYAYSQHRQDWTPLQRDVLTVGTRGPAVAAGLYFQWRMEEFSTLQHKLQQDARQAMSEYEQTMEAAEEHRRDQGTFVTLINAADKHLIGLIFEAPAWVAARLRLRPLLASLGITFAGDTLRQLLQTEEEARQVQAKIDRYKTRLGDEWEDFRTDERGCAWEDFVAGKPENCTPKPRYAKPAPGSTGRSSNRNLDAKAAKGIAFLRQSRLASGYKLDLPAFTKMDAATRGKFMRNLQLTLHPNKPGGSTELFKELYEPLKTYHDRQKAASK